MARVFKPTYPKPLPPDAQVITQAGRPHARFKDRQGKTVLAPLSEDGSKVLLQTAKWYVEYRDASGVVRKVPGYTDKKATEQLAADLERRAARQQVGLIDPFEEQRKRPLAEHLADYRRELESRDNTPSYVADVSARLTALVDGCGFRLLTDLSASRVADWLAGRRRRRSAAVLTADWYTRSQACQALGLRPAALCGFIRRHRLEAVGRGKARRYPRATLEAIQDRQVLGLSVQTTNYYLSHLKSFCHWLVKDRRLAENPFLHLEGGNARLDRRHDRRELTAVELGRLLAAARDSDLPFRGLTGPDRFHLYATACGTGFRASALASLTPLSFDLDSPTPTVTLAARHAKNRKTKVQPLPPDVADLLRSYLRDLPTDRPVWGGSWASDHKGAEMIRRDLEAAGIPYTVEGPDGPLYADFHALRHSYLTLLGRGGVDLRTVQELAGHSTPVLTARYSHRQLYDLAGALERLPNFLPPEDNSPTAQELRATGTQGKHVVQHVGAGRTPLHSDAPSCTPEGGDDQGMSQPKCLENQTVSSDLHQSASACTGRAGETSTAQPRIRTPEATMSQKATPNPERPISSTSAPAAPAGDPASVPGGDSVRGEVAGCPTGLPATPAPLVRTEDDDRDNPLRPDKPDVEPLEGRQEGGRE
jgi:integrase